MRIPYLREAGAIVLLALLTAGGAWLYRAGGNAARVDCLQAQAAQEAAYKAALAKEQERAADANDALRARLAKPAPGRTIREVVRANPSDCRIDPAVSAGVRQAVAEANARAAAK